MILVLVIIAVVATLLAATDDLTRPGAESAYYLEVGIAIGAWGLVLIEACSA